MRPNRWQYGAALIASGLSVAGWIGAVVAVGYAIYAVATGGPALLALAVGVAALFGGVVFARVERRLYDPSGD
jgi:hypothetical protein